VSKSALNLVYAFIELIANPSVFGCYRVLVNPPYSRFLFLKLCLDAAISSGGKRVRGRGQAFARDGRGRRQVEGQE
jgi:hypothetical protein